MLAAFFVLAGCTAPRRPAPPATPDRTDTVRQAIRDDSARRVILLVGDGLGDSEITIARNYHVGAGGRLNLDTLALTGTCTTYAVTEEDPSRPVYVVDSAASASALLTGRKTSNRRIATLPHSGRSTATILELAQQRGLRTGIVTTADLTDATPAAAAAHVNDRACQGPQEMGRCPQFRKSAGGPGSIAEQLVDHGVDVLLGGGGQRFAQTIADGPHRAQSVLQSAELQGYEVVTTTADLSATAEQVRRDGGKVLGLFAEEHFAASWSESPATPDTGATAPQRCGVNPAAMDQPTLAMLTRTALDLLDAGGDADGFFLEVEGASIDKQAHRTDACGQIGETIAFDEAVGVALRYARARQDTLVIVTGDHAHTSQIIPAVERRTRSPGSVSMLQTADGAPMLVNYATATDLGYQQHTGTQIRIAAEGPHAANVVGVIDQTDVFHIMAGALGLADF